MIAGISFKAPANLLCQMPERATDFSLVGRVTPADSIRDKKPKKIKTNGKNQWVTPLILPRGREMRTEIVCAALLLVAMGCVTSAVASENAASVAGKRGLSPIICPLLLICWMNIHDFPLFSGLFEYANFFVTTI
jgi:hypothetical protein